MAMWNPWRGCHRVSEGREHCYIHKGDARRGVDTNLISRLDGFDAPMARTSVGEYKMKPGQTVYLCFSSDFLLPEGDPWRDECWRIMRQRPDLHFLFLTKRIERFARCAPDDWGDGYDNVTVGVSVENQRRADERLPILRDLPIRHKNIICQPLLEAVDIEAYLMGTELVVAGGESDRAARPFDYSWALSLRDQCCRKHVSFEFRQCGTCFIKDGKRFILPVRQLGRQARMAGIDLHFPT